MKVVVKQCVKRKHRQFDWLSFTPYLYHVNRMVYAEFSKSSGMVGVGEDRGNPGNLRWVNNRTYLLIPEV